MPKADNRRNTAKLTGRKIDLSGQLLWECLCPFCDQPQFHPQGLTECIYCGESIAVSLIHAVEQAIPPEDPGNITGPIGA